MSRKAQTDTATATATATDKHPDENARWYTAASKSKALKGKALTAAQTAARNFLPDRDSITGKRRAALEQQQDNIISIAADIAAHENSGAGLRLRLLNSGMLYVGKLYGDLESALADENIGDAMLDWSRTILHNIRFKLNIAQGLPLTTANPAGYSGWKSQASNAIRIMLEADPADVATVIANGGHGWADLLATLPRRGKGGRKAQQSETRVVQVPSIIQPSYFADHPADVEMAKAALDSVRDRATLIAFLTAYIAGEASKARKPQQARKGRKATAAK